MSEDAETTDGAGPPRRSGDGRGGFFAVDRRAWAFVCGLGLNAAVSYLAIACGTGGDNRTSKWSAKAIRKRTAISRSRAPAAIAALERAGAILRDPTSKPSHPKYKIVPAHQIPGCEGYPPALDAGERELLRRVEAGTATPSTTPEKALGNRSPNAVFRSLQAKGLARPIGNTALEIRPYDAEVAANPQWIWLPNALVDGAAGETPPIELVRQTGDAPTLRLFVDLYGAQLLDEDGGIHFRRIRLGYARHEVGQQGPYVVWGFVPGVEGAWPDAPFVAPHLTGRLDEKGRDTGLDAFWACWRRLRDAGLVEFVAHLVDADAAEGEILHPLALPGTGLEIEHAVLLAAARASFAMITPEQRDRAQTLGVVALAPVLRHIDKVQMLGVARLRYRPKTARTAAFMGREEEWREHIARFSTLAGDPAPSRAYQGSIKGLGASRDKRPYKG